MCYGPDSYHSGRYYSYHGLARTLRSLQHFLEHDADKVERPSVLPSRAPFWYSLQIVWFNRILDRLVRPEHAPLAVHRVRDPHAPPQGPKPPPLFALPAQPKIARLAFW